jgi:hypothetical protein
MGPMTNWLVALLGAVVGAALGRWTQRAKHNEELRSTAYADYLRAVAAAAHAQSVEDQRGALRDGADAKARIAVYGSGDVIRSLARFEESGANLASERARAPFVAIVSAMRPRGDSVSDRELSLLLVGPSVESSLNALPSGTSRLRPESP